MIDADARTRPQTKALRRALAEAGDSRAIEDLLFLERWVLHRTPNLAATLRAGQIRRANADLADEIERELAQR